MTALSYVHGSTGPPLLGASIGDFFDDVVAAHGDREAVVCVAQGIRWTYRELRDYAERFAAGLIELGLEPGDRIGLWSPNRGEWVVVQFAAAKAGLVLVNINPAYQAAELEHVLRAAGCKALVTAGQFKSSDYVAMVRGLIGEQGQPIGGLAAPSALELRRVIVFDDAAPHPYLSYSAVLDIGECAGTERVRARQSVSFDAPVDIQFTSGTTGLPKGVTLTHHNLLNNGLQVAVATGIQIGDRVCLPVPLYHCFGMVMGVLACLARAATAVLPGEAFQPAETLSAVQQERCTHLYGVPTMFIAMLADERFGDFDLSALRGGIMAGAPCPAEVMKAVMSDMNMAEVTIAYGMTETSPVSFQTRPDDPLAARVATVGRIMPHLEVKIVDEADRITPIGVPGQVCTRGYSVMSGYWGEPERTQEVLDADGWMHTGDVGVLDQAGYCQIVGRTKDLVIRGGENISPREVEEFLYRHPAVRDVQVFGVPDAKFGEELCAWIVLRAGAAVEPEDIRTFCKGRIAHFKVPRYVKFVEGYPTTTSGKVQKFILRDRAASELGLAGRASP